MISFNKRFYKVVISLLFFVQFSLNSISNGQILSKNLNTAVYDISYFIASDHFLKLRMKNDDLALVDSIYLYAVKYYEKDYSEALLALTFSTLPFREMPLSLPLLGSGLNIPLPSVNDSLFVLKVNNLPKIIFFDSPKSEFGDKDKLPHFFGNAFLSYNISLFNISKFMGILIELFEDSFEVEGGISYRDFITNELGSLFGKMINENKQILPSKVLILYSLLFYKYYL